MSDLLSKELIDEFRNQINESNIFIYDTDLNKLYNLICVVMDRLDSCIKYINLITAPPKTEHDLLIYIMYCCMVKDAVFELLKEFKIKNEFLNPGEASSYIYFKEICLMEPLNIPSRECPIDDKFFEYIRSLAFAHPFKTDRPRFFQNGEVQYSPWVIANSKLMSLRGFDDGVGIRIYSNKRSEIIDLILPFQKLQLYIKSRYLLIENAIAKVKDIILEKENSWKLEYIPANLSSLEILEFMQTKLTERHIDCYLIEDSLSYLRCDITDIRNQANITLLREAIIQTIPFLINSFHSLDFESMFNALHEIISARPSNMHNMAYYQLEKIYSYLNSDFSTEKTQWALMQAELFAKEFAKKWVSIDTNKMSFVEIKLLVTTACYLEFKDQISKH